jgi:hypothetical protein
MARSRLTSALQELVDLWFVEATAPAHSPNRRYRAIRLRYVPATTQVGKVSLGVARALCAGTLHFMAGFLACAMETPYGEIPERL